jgi:hemoglobin-like flavoprotein
MTPSQLRLVRGFFANNEAQLNAVFSQMYDVFFALAPDAKRLFKAKMTFQQAEIAQMFQGIVILTRCTHLWPVAGLTGQAAIPVLGELGCRHAKYGILPEHFEKMKQAFLQTFGAAFPTGFTAEVREAFAAFFDVLSNSMTRKMYGEREDGAGEVRFLRRDAGPERYDFNSFFGESAEA